MSDSFTSDGEEPQEGEDRTITATFGTGETQTSPWTDRRSMSWPNLASLLTNHRVGPKEGACIVPAAFRGTRRHKSDADRIEVAMLDSDSGATLREIATALGGRGWAAAISSSHSHLSCTTRAKRGVFEAWLAKQGLAANASGSPEAFLIADKGMRPEIAAGAIVTAQDDTHVTFTHQPCPKFRVALPLSRAWAAEGYESQTRANTAWRICIEALATALGLDHDQACTDTSRLFYLPRRPVDGLPAETQVLEGEWVDAFALPPPPEPEPAASRGKKSRRSTRSTASQERAAKSSDLNLPSDLDFTDPATGEVENLVRWAARTAPYFAIVAALKVRSPHVFVGRVADSIRHHIRCPNEAAHTEPGVDAATFVCDAAESPTGSFVLHCRHAHCTGRDRLLMLRQMLEQGWLQLEDLHDPRFQPGAPPPRPTIQIIAGEIPRVVDQGEEALIQAKLGLYQRGPFLVRAGTVMVQTARKREVEARRIFEIEEHALVEQMTRAAHWERFDGRSEQWVTTDAPMKVANTYRQRKGHWRLDVLAGLINCPTLRADGSVLSRHGYDRTTGLLLDTGGVLYPPVPQNPCWDEGRAAASVLLQLIEKFPFVTDHDRAVALSTILTGCIRRSLPTAPLHAFTAPVMGSGKSKLVDIACLIATGREAAVMSQGKTEEEFEKRIGSLLLAGETVIPIDNCEAPLGGEFLCTILTQTVARTRILGRSETPELPTNAMITATGNNLLLVGDLTRRAVLCRLDPNCERPELRRFDTDPLAEIKADRSRFLIAALTALRAYRVAGRPEHQHAPLGSFEVWSRTIRDAIVWLGFEDPVATMDSLREGDPNLDSLTAVMAHWVSVIGSRKVATREIIEEAVAQVTPSGIGFVSARAEFRHPDFREALLAVAGDAGAINGRRLGKWLTAQQGRIVDGLRIRRLGLTSGTMQWQLETLREGQRAAA